MTKRRKLIWTLSLLAACLCAGVALIFARGNAPATLAGEVCVHDYSELVRTVSPTCTDDGYDIMRCAKCGETSNYYHYGADDYEESYQALGHLWDEEENIIVVAPTCTESGITCHYCPRCCETYTEKPTNPTGHDFDVTTFDPDCLEAGYTLHYCEKCGYSYTDGGKDALGHAFVAGEVTAEASCTAHGEQIYSCSRCGETETRTIPATGHSYTSETVEPGCEAYGYTLYTCSNPNCGDSYYDDVTAPYGHIFDGLSQVVATEESYGYVKLSCSVCGYVYITNIVSPGDKDEEHDFVLTVVPANCYGGGYWIYECGSCGAYVICNETDKLEHDWVSEYVAPTCTEPGGVRRVCLNCEDFYWESEEEATGHDLYVSASADVTCTEDGYTVYDCRDCSYTYMIVTPATGHIYEVKNAVVSPDKTLSLTYTCYSCSSSAISRLYVVFADSYGGSYTYYFDSNGVADFSTLPDGFYTASVCDAVLGEVVFMFVTGEESYDEGSYSGDSGEEHVHSYVPTVALNASAKTVTVSYKCSCGDDLTEGLVVTFTGEDGTRVSCITDSSGTVSFASLSAGSYEGYVYRDDERVASFSLTIESASTGGSAGDTEGDEDISGGTSGDTDTGTSGDAGASGGAGNTGDEDTGSSSQGADTGVAEDSDASAGGASSGSDAEKDTGTADSVTSDTAETPAVTDDGEKKSNNTTIIVLLVVFVVFVAAIIAVWIVFKRRSKKKATAEEGNPDSVTDGGDNGTPSDDEDDDE